MWVPAAPIRRSIWRWAITVWRAWLATILAAATAVAAFRRQASPRRVLAHLSRPTAGLAGHHPRAATRMDPQAAEHGAAMVADHKAADRQVCSTPATLA